MNEGCSLAPLSSGLGVVGSPLGLLARLEAVHYKQLILGLLAPLLVKKFFSKMKARQWHNEGVVWLQ